MREPEQPQVKIEYPTVYAFKVMGKQEHGFFRMVHESFGQTWLIFNQEGDAVFSGNILRGHYGEFIPRNSFTKPDSKNFPACD